MFFNNCPCKFKHYDECNQYPYADNNSQKSKCGCRYPEQGYQKPQKPCDCHMNISERYDDKSRSECKFCIEGTIRFKNNCNMW